MKNKILRLALPVLALVMMLTLASCKGNDNPSIIGTSAPDTTTAEPQTTPPETTTAHVHSYKDTVYPATCTAAGYTLHMCDCGDQYVDTPTPLAAHTYGEWETTTAPTCTAEGIQTRKCTVCGTSETQKIAAAGHKFVDSVIAPTKTTQGYTVHTCSVCKYNYSDSYTNATGSLGLSYSQNADGTLTVTGTGLCLDTEIIIYSTNADGKNVTAIAEGAFAGNTTVKSIYLPASIISIGEGAFAGCTSLNSITVEADNKYYTSVNDVLYTKDAKTIVAFPAGKALTEYSVASTITDVRPSAFAGCVNLTQFKLADTSSKYFYVSDGVLYKLNASGAAATLVAYPAGKTVSSFNIPSSVTAIGDYAFYGAKKLDSVTLNTGLSTIGAHAFDGCSFLTWVTLPNSVVKLGDYAFANCSRLSVVSIGAGLDTISAHAFDGCTAIKSLIIPDTVYEIKAYAFNNCTGMTEVVIGSKVDTIGENAFAFCNSLKSVYYKGLTYQDHWSRINVHPSNNFALTITATLYYYSDTAKSGCWHYADASETTPVAW